MSEHHPAPRKKRMPVEEIGLHVILGTVLLFVVAVCATIGYAIFWYGLLPSFSYRFAAILILVGIIAYAIQSIRDTYTEFFVTRRS